MNPIGRLRVQHRAPNAVDERLPHEIYSGKAFHGLVEEIGRGRWAGASDVVFVHTGGIFGLLAQADQALPNI